MTYFVDKLLKRHKKNLLNLLLMPLVKTPTKRDPPKRRKGFTDITTSSQRKPHKDDEEVSDRDTDLVG